MLMKQDRSSQSGAIYLTVAVMLVLILTGIALTIQMITLFSVHLSRTQAAEKMTYYATEAVLHDTISRAYYSYFMWPVVAPNQQVSMDPPQLPGVTLTRTVSRDANDMYVIDITAASRQATRRLVAKLANPYTASTLIDIVLVTDTSFSMDDLGCDVSLDNCEPITSAQNAMTAFMAQIDANPAAQNFAVSLVSYGDIAVMKQPLTTSIGDVKNEIEDLQLEGNTNVHHGLQLAETELLTNGTPGAKKFIVLLTDGIPNRYGDPVVECEGYPMATNICIDQALTMASQIKSNGVEIYTIGLGLSTPSGFIQQPQIDLARTVLDSIASNPPVQYSHFAPTQAELDQLYQNILDQILMTSNFTIHEIAPGDPIP